VPAPFQPVELAALGFSVALAAREQPEPVWLRAWLLLILP